MPKQIVADTFETLGGIAKQTGKQIVQTPFKIAETASGQVGVKTAQEMGIEQSQGGQRQNLVQQALNKRATERKLTYLQDELRRFRQQKAQELPREVTGKPGFSKEKAIKQLETQKRKEEIEPPAVAQARLKGGTGERKRMGVSG